MNERDVQAALEVLLHSDVWIGDDGEPLDYLPERETRIGTLAHDLAALVAQARSDALREAADDLAAEARLLSSGPGDKIRRTTLNVAAKNIRRKIRADLARAAASSHPTGNQPAGSAARRYCEILRGTNPSPAVLRAIEAIEAELDDHPTGNQP